MPEQVIQTHIQSPTARDYVDDCLSAWEAVSSLETEKREKQKQVLRARYHFGREAAAAAQAAEEGDTIPESGADIKRELAQRRDRSKRWVNKHIAFYRACLEEYPGWDTPNGIPADGYVRRCEEGGYKLTWASAYQWASDSDENEDDEEPDTALGHKIKELEDVAMTLDEKTQELHQLLDGEDEDAEGVRQLAHQTIEQLLSTLQRLINEAGSDANRG